MAEVDVRTRLRRGDRSGRHRRQNAFTPCGLGDHLDRPLPQALARDQLADEPEFERLPRRDRPSGPEDLPGGLHADEAGQPLGAAGARDDAQVRLRLHREHPESLPADPGVAGHGQLVAAADRHPVQGADDGLREARDPVQHLVRGAGQPLPVFRAADPGQCPHVGARDERLHPEAGDHHPEDPVVRLHVGEVGVQLPEDLLVQRAEHLGPADGQHRHRARRRGNVAPAHPGDRPRRPFGEPPGEPGRIEEVRLPLPVGGEEFRNPGGSQLPHEPEGVHDREGEVAGHVQVRHRDRSLRGGPGGQSQIRGGDPFLDAFPAPFRNGDLFTAAGHVPHPSGGTLLRHRLLEQPRNPEPGVETLVHLGEPLVGDRVAAGEVHGGERPDPEAERPAGDVVHLLRGPEPLFDRKRRREEHPLEDRIQGVPEPALDGHRHLADLLVEPEQPRHEAAGGFGGDDLHDRVALRREEVVRDRRAARFGELGEDAGRLDVGGVRQQHRPGTCQLLDRPEDPTLDGQVLGGRLDDQVHPGELTVVAREPNGAAHPLGLGITERARADPLVDLPEHLPATGLEGGLRDVQHHRLHSTGREGLDQVKRDVGSDLTRADDCGAADVPAAPGKAPRRTTHLGRRPKSATATARSAGPRRPGRRGRRPPRTPPPPRPARCRTPAR